ncbi:AAA family ATPase [Helicobacter anatolicus]|uniref:AAA family ATPase n=1 Tax=Helicobacter anatolicus TaxID=2905874 RepID=UPI001E4942CA|nr:AAA family ATPase [Helicobacter anatolicus]MCE3040499.1 AAA family ATPase [Helicobacter anatolicus]
MIKKMYIHHYRKLRDIEINFSREVNIISGVNGACKSSILYLVCNAFQDITKKSSPSFTIISKSNEKWNPKIENLTKGDKQYNDPAIGTEGSLLEIEYYGQDTSLPFRRHNGKGILEKDRYRLIPTYPRGSGMSLPMKPRIYLGTSRLSTFSEFNSSPHLFEYIDELENKLTDEGSIKLLHKIKEEISNSKITKQKLPERYLLKLQEIYKSVTRHFIEISDFTNISMPYIKKRVDFKTQKEGIDSNTISSGEDNLMIILYALVSLSYYYETTSLEDKSSILLIDELDATLHPNVQRKILNIFREYSQRYQIQIIATTHSLSLLESAYKKKDNIIYLREIGGEKIALLTQEQANPSIIASQLLAQDRSEIYRNKYIACFVEDEEAKCLLDLVFQYYLINKEAYTSFAKFKRFFLPIVAKLGCGQLRDMTTKMSSWAVFAILDQDEKKDLSNRIITLPGSKMSPEKMIHRYYAEELRLNSESNFWKEMLDVSIEKLDDVFSELENLLAQCQENDKKKIRDVYKQHFQDNKDIYEILFRSWMHEHPDEMRSFYNDLSIMFNKVADNAGIYDRMEQV